MTRRYNVNKSSGNSAGYLGNKVRDYSITSKNIDSIFDAMSKSGGFESRNLSAGVDILQRMQNDDNCTKFLSFVGAIISTGTRGIIRDMLKNKMFDCVITTCGAIDHDIARTYE
jgi:deoxyhypusine synthase